MMGTFHSHTYYLARFPEVYTTPRPATVSPIRIQSYPFLFHCDHVSTPLHQHNLHP